MNNFGDRLKELRHRYGYTQKKVAEDMGMTFSAMSQYETGKRTPKNDILINLATYFDVSVDYLLGMDINTSKDYGMHMSQDFSNSQIVSSHAVYEYNSGQNEESLNSDLASSKARILASINKLPKVKQREILAAIELLLGTLN